MWYNIIKKYINILTLKRMIKYIMKANNVITSLWDDKEKRYSLITAILLVTMCFVISIDCVILDKKIYYISINLFFYLIVIYALFRKNNRLILISYFIFIVIQVLDYFITFLKYGYYEYAMNIINAILSITPLIAMSILFYLRIKNKIIYKKIWIVPSVFFLVYVIIPISHIVINININMILHFFTFFFLGLYCKYSTNKPIRPKNKLPQTQLGNADKLLKYKELLDLNIITQDEFNEKKNELI